MLLVLRCSDSEDDGTKTKVMKIERVGRRETEGCKKMQGTILGVKWDGGKSRKLKERGGGRESGQSRGGRKKAKSAFCKQVSIVTGA